MNSVNDKKKAKLKNPSERKVKKIRNGKNGKGKNGKLRKKTDKKEKKKLSKSPTEKPKGKSGGKYRQKTGGKLAKKEKTKDTVKENPDKIIEDGKKKLPKKLRGEKKTINQQKKVRKNKDRLKKQPGKKSNTSPKKGSKVKTEKEGKKKKVPAIRKQKQSATTVIYATRVSEVCDSSIKLDYNEKVIVYSVNDRQKKRCKAKFKSKPGTTIRVSCPQFNLNSKGCKTEMVELNGKESGRRKRKRYCKKKSPSEVIMSANRVTLKYTRKKLSKKQCSGGFLCEVYTYMSMDQQEFEDLQERYRTLQTLQFNMDNFNSHIPLVKYHLDTLLQQIVAVLDSKRRRRRSIASLERLVDIIDEADAAAWNEDSDALIQLLSEILALLDEVVNLRNQIAANPSSFDLAILMTITESGLQSITFWESTYSTQSTTITDELID